MNTFVEAQIGTFNEEEEELELPVHTNIVNINVHYTKDFFVTSPMCQNLQYLITIPSIPPQSHLIFWPQLRPPSCPSRNQCCLRQPKINSFRSMFNCSIISLL